MTGYLLRKQCANCGEWRSPRLPRRRVEGDCGLCGRTT